MPRKTTEFMVDTTGPQRIALDEIPDEVKQFVEEVYAKQRKNPGRTRVSYDTSEELDIEFKFMVDYAAQRPAGILTVRRSPTRATGFPKGTDLSTVMDFRITANVEANGARNAGNDRRQDPARASTK